MYRNVVVGIDGRTAGRDAIALAETLTPEHKHLTLVHVRVLEFAPLRGAAFDAESQESSAKLLEQQRDRTSAAAEILSVLASGVGAGLHDAAESRGADLLVVGRCHRSDVAGIVAGNNTHAALHQAPCAVAVAVAPDGYAARAKRPKVIGIAYDGSPDSKAALSQARRLAHETGARLLACHVLEMKVYGAGGFAPGVVEAPEDQAARARNELGDLGDAELIIADGAVGPELADFTANIDLLLCGSRQNGIVKRVVLGSTSDYLARHCHCPLIVTPAVVQRPETSAGHTQRPIAIA